MLLAPLAVFLIGVSGLPAEDQPQPGAAKSTDKAVEAIAESVRKSVVVITVAGRDGKREGLGTGFVVAAHGVIATNLHVIGEARPIRVQTADGKKHDVTAVHATDRASDLALLRIDAKDLTPLDLGDSDKLKEGQQVVAVGNPRGLAHSIVSGVVSARREVEGRPMIQLAMPIESGNSGGPLLDLQGRVQGILTMRSAVTANLGFAMPVNALKPLLKKPNPIPMARWLTIGVLDAEEWKPVFGGQWRQRAGRILVEGEGGGFGGRTLCLHQRPLPEVPFEIAVTVKLGDETGAAGLIFHADGGDKHYGFYPSAGELRFVRFEGPDVYSWKILQRKPSKHYRLGEWNTLKVRIEKDKIRCFVNEQLVTESADNGLTSGKVGLASFRGTKAEFKNFRVAKEIKATGVSADVAARITKAVQDIPAEGPLKPELIDKLAPDGPASLEVLRERAKLLEQQAVQLRQLAQAVHHKRTQTELAKVMTGKEEDIDLIHAALLIARLDNDEVDVEAYRKEVDRMAREVTAGLAKDVDEKAKLAALNKYLFAERGYHGSRGDYYHRSNSYLNEVIDDREGLPITLSVLYLEVARRLGLKVEGVALPGHFVTRFVPAKGEPQLIDVFEGGQALSREDAAKKVEALTGEPVKDEHLAPAAKKAIVVRMLHNLMNLAESDRDAEGMLRYLDTILAVAPDSVQERGMRAALRAQTGRRQGALEDLDWMLEHKPPDVDLEKVRAFRRRLLEQPER
jgi:regulator of sirC expression with transglutaminase-like and TPR domain